MILHRVAAGLVFVTGLAVLRLSVVLESWPLLGVGLAAAAVGIAWFLFAGPGGASRAERSARPTVR